MVSCMLDWYETMSCMLHVVTIDIQQEVAGGTSKQADEESIL